MAKRKFEVGGRLTYEFRIVRYHPDTGVTVEFADGIRKTMAEDDPGIKSVEAASKTRQRPGKIGTSPLAKLMGDD